MKTSYLPRNRQKFSYTKPILILAIIFIVGAFIFSLVDGLVIRLFAPVWRSENVVTRAMSGSVNYFRSRQALFEENQALKDKLALKELELEAKPLASNSDSTFDELVVTRDALGGILSGVLVRPPQTPYDILIVDAGENKGVFGDSRVYLKEGVLIGTVTEVLPTSAKVTLYSANGVKTNAVLERHNVPVVLEGVGAGNFKIALPRETQVEKGDRILASDLSSELVGIVEDVKLEPTDSFKEVLVRTPVNIFGIRLVLIRQ
jgi:cell shape-determining protein MreC